MENLCDVKQTNDIALLIANGLAHSSVSHSIAESGPTYQVTEVLLDHELQRLGCASGVPGDHMVPRHDMFDSSMVRVNAFRSDLCPVSQHISQKSNLLNLRGMPGPWP